MGIVKNFSIHERFKAQIRAELFNAFNHAQFVFGGASLASFIAAPPPGETQPAIQYVDPSQFGRASARPPRIVQFAAKWIW